jgi:hypothetical protein
MVSTVFFGDILGFARSSRAPGAQGALDALEDVAQLLSREHEIARYLQIGAPWTSRYGLSDSIFLVADQPELAVRAASELFFNLAYYKSSQPASEVLLRGALACGEVHRADPIFPETASGNLVGDAVVQAVRLEQSGAKGPRLLLSEEVAQALEASPTAWLLDRTVPDPHEVLWILPPELATASGAMIGSVARAAVNLLRAHVDQDAVVVHYLAYVDLVVRSLARLRQKAPQVARVALSSVDLEMARGLVVEVSNRVSGPCLRVTEQIQELLK